MYILKFMRHINISDKIQKTFINILIKKRNKINLKSMLIQVIKFIRCNIHILKFM